jgi:PadR family transcriptional regulator, regulatory protein PadR
MKLQPLRDASYFALAALVDGPAHGYAILQSIRSLTEETTQMAVATLYGTLDRLHADALIEVISEDIIDGRARRTFAISDGGLNALHLETQRREASTEAVRARLTAVTATGRKPRLSPRPMVGGAQ